MKKVFAFAAAIVLFAGIANAQIGINAGYATQNYYSTYTNGNTNYNDTIMMSGFFVGGNYNLNLTGDINLFVGLQLRYNTYSDSASGTIYGLANGKVKRNDEQMLIDVPILVNYGFNLTDDLKLSVFAGPTISYALSGKTTVTSSGNVLFLSGSSTDEINWYNADEGNMSPLDVSFTLGLNFDYKGFRLFGGFNMGMMNLSKEDKTTMKGNNLFVGIGYAL
ncbi:MAG: outer membrane beta-barrel protein [Bacteroidales bacterium]|nr:outer membrane beta-barrel protein [Bacteroidales bacterium]